jgi:hypothetical protein
MDVGRFERELPRLFERFPESPRPRDRRFEEVLEAVPGLARENNLALLNLAAGLLGSGESYVEVGSYRGTSLIAAMLGNDGEFVAIDDFSFEEATREGLEASLQRFGLEGATIVGGDAFEVLEGACSRAEASGFTTTTRLTITNRSSEASNSSSPTSPARRCSSSTTRTGTRCDVRPPTS